MTKILVTGGAGYVGSHCCKAFAAAGWNVVVYDNLSRGWRDFARWGPLIEGDILDKEKLAAAMKREKPDAVAHFAALAYVEESTRDPASYYRVNTTGALNVLDAMRQNDVSSFLFSSTCATYGVPTQIPIDENHSQVPINPYGRSKLMVELLLADHAAAYGLRAIALRYFNAAGADADGEIGERHEPETHVIPLAVASALRNNDIVFNIFGNDFDTRDGTAIRDYIHVTDLADAHCRSIGRMLKSQKGAFEAFNLGSGAGTTVAEIASAVERVSGRSIIRNVAGRRAGDPPALVATAEKAQEILGWRAMHSSIDNIIQTAWNWHSRERQRG